MKILVTGFDPFGGEMINPSIEAVRRLPKTINGATIVVLELPTVFEVAAKQCREAILEHQVDAVLCVGQAGGRHGMTLERVAINVDDARIPDNIGQQPIDHAIQVDGPAAYFSTLPIKAMVQAMQEAGIPATISNTAGTFVCNHILYQTLYMAAHEYPHLKAGFMHIPFMTEQVVDKLEQPSMDLADMTKGLEVALHALVDYYDKQDVNISGGKEF